MLEVFRKLEVIRWLDEVFPDPKRSLAVPDSVGLPKERRRCASGRPPANKPQSFFDTSPAASCSWGCWGFLGKDSAPPSMCMKQLSQQRLLIFLHTEYFFFVALNVLRNPQPLAKESRQRLHLRCDVTEQFDGFCFSGAGPVRCHKNPTATGV